GADHGIELVVGQSREERGGCEEVTIGHEDRIYAKRHRLRRDGADRGRARAAAVRCVRSLACLPLLLSRSGPWSSPGAAGRASADRSSTWSSLAVAPSTGPSPPPARCPTASSWSCRPTTWPDPSPT